MRRDAWLVVLVVFLSLLWFAVRPTNPTARAWQPDRGYVTVPD